LVNQNNLCLLLFLIHLDKTTLLLPPSSPVSAPMASAEEQLVWASLSGNLLEVELLCSDSSVDVNWRFQGSFTPLYCACQEGRVNVVQFLLARRGINVNLPQNQGVTPFYVACQRGFPDVVALLVADERVEVNVRIHNGVTALMAACQRGFASVVRRCLESAKIDVNMASEAQGVTTFFVACQEGHADIVRMLQADPRVDVTKPNNRGATPMLTACYNRHREVVALLLADPRVDPQQAKSNGSTPFLMACYSGSEEIVSMLLQDPRVDVNTPQNEGATPLYMATQNGHLSIVQMILAFHGDVATRLRITTADPDEDGKTAAEWARALVTLPKREYMGEDAHLRIKTLGPTLGNLIVEYEADMATVRASLQRLPHIQGYFIAHTFALLIFYADSFLQTTPAITPSSVTRFLTMSSKLPLDLQMVLCHRMFGSAQNLILSRDSEPAFRWLGNSKTWKESH